MLVLRSPDAAAAITDPLLRAIVNNRFAMLSEEEPFAPGAMGYFIVCEPEDTLVAIEKQLGFSLLANRSDGTRFGDAAFTPSFELLESHATCYEMVFVLSDDGYGVEVFIPKNALNDARLLAMCERYALPAKEAPAP